MTDPGNEGPQGVLRATRLALLGGAPAVQLRDKETPPERLVSLAAKLRDLAKRAGALFFVNDHLDLALEVRADGVHLGPGDLNVAVARREAPPGFLIGYSAGSPSSAREGARLGADYLGSGPLFPTSTKVDAREPIGPRGLARIVRAAEAPVVAIGGITAQNARVALSAGAVGCAASASIMRASDPKEATRRFLSAAKAADAVWKPRGSGVF